MDMHKKVLLSCATLAATGVAFAGGDKDYDRELVMRDDRVYEEEEEGFFELLVFGGVASMDPESTTLHVSPDETDLLTNSTSDDWDSWTAQVGVGYVYPIEGDDMYTGDVRWFANINPQLNLYYLDASDMNGDTYLFQDPSYNLADWNMEFNSTRLMFDLALTVATLERLSLYVLGGAGVAFNRTELNSIAHPGSGIADVYLDSEDSTSFAYEFGGGLTYALMDDLAVSLEYLFTGINDVGLGETTTTLGCDQTFNISGGDMDIDSQALMLGLRLAL